MRVEFLPPDPENDPLRSTPIIPDRYKGLLLPNSEKLFYHTKTYEYVEQRFVRDDCAYALFDIYNEADQTTHPVSRGGTLLFVQMFEGTVPCNVYGYRHVMLVQGNSYLIYLPKNAKHDAHFPKGHAQVGHFYMTKSYVENLIKEYPAIGIMFELFSNESPAGLMDNPAVIDSNTLFHVNLIKHCNGSKGFRDQNLRACGLNLVLDYVRKANVFAEFKVPVADLAQGYQVYKAKEIIDNYQSGKLLVPQIAKMVGLRKGKLEKEYQQVFGSTIGKDLLIRKMAVVRCLLADTDKTIAQIARHVGYRYKSNLTRKFKEEVNLTPFDYRRYVMFFKTCPIDKRE